MKIAIDRTLIEKERRLFIDVEYWGQEEGKAAGQKLQDLYHDILSGLTEAAPKKSGFGWMGGGFTVDEECITTPAGEHYWWGELEEDNIIEV